MNRYRFAAARTRPGSTERQPAGLPGVSHKAVQRYEQGRQAIPIQAS